MTQAHLKLAAKLSEKGIHLFIYVIKHGLQWQDAPREYGPYKTLYNRFLRWSRMGIFNNIFTELAKTAGMAR